MNTLRMIFTFSAIVVSLSSLAMADPGDTVNLTGFTSYPVVFGGRVSNQPTTK